jgi:hypothetical protein
MRTCRDPLKSLGVFPIPVRWRLRNHKEMNLVPRIVPHVVRCAGRNPNPFPGSQNNRTPIYFHNGRTRKHVEELLRATVQVPSFRRVRRHALLYYAQLRILYQVPAITLAAPDVMLGG